MSRTTELGTAPIHKLLFKYAMPAIIAMTATSLYNIVDTIYIGHGCGALALGALTVAKPFMDICAAFGSLVGVGASSLLAIYLGEKDYDRANRVLGNVIVMNVILSAIVMAVGLIWLDPILYAFGASEDTILYAHEYMEIILYGNILTHIYSDLHFRLGIRCPRSRFGDRHQSGYRCHMAGYQILRQERISPISSGYLATQQAYHVPRFGDRYVAVLI